MEIIKGDGKILERVDLAPANVHQEVLQNVAIILDTIRKSCPLLRRLGIPGDLFGRPLPVVENTLVGEIYDQIEMFEPRAIISEVNFERDELHGLLIPVVTLEGVKESG